MLEKINVLEAQHVLEGKQSACVWRHARWRGTDTTHVQQHDGELGSTALHGMLHHLGTQAVRWVLVHGGIHSHHVVHTIVLKSMTSKEEQSVHVCTQH